MFLKLEKFFLFFIILMLLNPAYCFHFKKFKKKKKPVNERMVETIQEWEIEAKNVPLEERKLDRYQNPKSDKKNFFPTPNFQLEKYNNPPGKIDFNIENIKKNLKDYPVLVANQNFTYVAYTQFYFEPDNEQISSAFFVEKLPPDTTKIKQLLNYKHCQKTRIPVLESGTKETYNNLFNSLSLVDWSNDGKKVLIKEQIGSTVNGIYKTNIYVYFLNEDDDEDMGYSIKLDDLDSTIKNYFLDYNNIQLQKYKYTLEPLGFSAENDDIIIVLSYAYDKNNRKYFLGAWSYNCLTYEILLLSKTNTQYPVSINGLKLMLRFGS